MFDRVAYQMSGPPKEPVRNEFREDRSSVVGDARAIVAAAADPVRSAGDQCRGRTADALIDFAARAGEGGGGAAGEQHHLPSFIVLVESRRFFHRAWGVDVRT